MRYVRVCYYDEGMSIAEIMSAYKLDYISVITEIRKGPI